MNRPPDQRIKPITAAQCLPLRQAVLWPQATLDEVRLADDAEGLHLGAFVGTELCSVASFFVPGPGQARLRKFATATVWQGQGLGSALLREGARQLHARGVGTLWFDARESATAFYRRFGFQVDSVPFLKGTVRYVRMRGSLDTLLSH
ncbi:GNAT family N-acetyltransferase [Oleiagrimonas sp. C23AA]|uniref:GNAT family N-acetyltransferase n=1 Tax=Oleiagrimonas sp. C23AA TaxID=2719047 RepID=UPI00141DD6FA|nr:GNAT family N-acetyltransferase [Oleiagrimonas sp. C23AA]NII11245.1 GNAT family N-acetyltransferase [Oleiagrimonas sp. C23AA]